MPVYNRRFLNRRDRNPFPPHLANVGPRLRIRVSIPKALEEILKRKNQKIPAPVEGYCLIDTGASVTAVDRSALILLRIQPIDKLKISTPDEAKERYVYPALFIFPPPLPSIEFNRVISLELRHLKIIALLGRDILQHCAFFYNGVGASFTLAL